MTQDEAIKVLSILKAAYPNSYKGMTTKEANGTIMIWSVQFAAFPVNVVLIAINKIISYSPFPPSISEVKDQLRSMYYEAKDMLTNHEYATEGFRVGNDPNEEPLLIGEPLDPQTLETVKTIIQATEPLRTASFGLKQNEMSLSAILDNSGGLLLENKKGE